MARIVSKLLFGIGILILGTTFFVTGVSQTPIGLIIGVGLILPYLYGEYRSGAADV